MLFQPVLRVPFIIINNICFSKLVKCFPSKLSVDTSAGIDCEKSMIINCFRINPLNTLLVGLFFKLKIPTRFVKWFDYPNGEIFGPTFAETVSSVPNQLEKAQLTGTECVFRQPKTDLRLLRSDH